VLRFIAFLAIAIVSVSAKEPSQTPEAGAKFVARLDADLPVVTGGAGEKTEPIHHCRKKIFTQALIAILAGCAVGSHRHPTAPTNLAPASGVWDGSLAETLTIAIAKNAMKRSTPRD